MQIERNVNEKEDDIVTSNQMTIFFYKKNKSLIWQKKKAMFKMIKY